MRPVAAPTQMAASGEPLAKWPATTQARQQRPEASVPSDVWVLAGAQHLGDATSLQTYDLLGIC